MKTKGTKIEDNECYGVAITLLGVDRGKICIYIKEKESYVECHMTFFVCQ